jgi:signal transduction histidine kinase
MTSRAPATRPLPFGGLQSRIIVFIAGLLVTTLAGVLLVVNYVNLRSARAAVDEELALGERVFQLLLEQNNQQLSQAAAILSLDFAFREAVATRDVQTTQSVLANHGARIGADLATLVSLDRVVLADAIERDTAGRAFPYPWLITAAEREGSAAGLVVKNGSLYQLVLVPVRAPEPIAWAAFGLLLRDRFDKQLQGLTRMKLAFFERNTGDPGWRRLSATPPDDLQEAEREALSRGGAAASRSLTIQTAAGEFGALLVPLERRGSVELAATLARSVDQAMAPYRRLAAILLALGVAALLLSVAGSVLIARGITRPIQALAEMSRRIEKGDFTHPVVITTQDEVGELASRFNLMREGLRELNENLEKRVADRTAELQSANGQLEAFSYSVSHDLRAPLRAIEGFAENLRRQAAGELSEDNRRLLDRIEANARRMDALITDLLAFARTSRSVMNLEPVDLNLLAREVIVELRDSYPRTAIEVGPLRTVNADRALLRQVLFNLIGNALKFSAKRDAPRVEIGCADVAGENTLFVRDNGAGLDMKFSGKLFGVFQRMHRQDEFEGTGIGLAIVHNIVQRHGGRIWVDSAPGQGATFYFTLGDAAAL